MMEQKKKKKNPTHDDFMKRTYNRKYQSVWTAITGPNQAGKTDFALFQFEKLHKLGLADGFGSNIPDLKADFHIDFIEDFVTLKKTCQMLNPNPEKHGIKRYFFLGDELGDWAPRDMPWLNVKLIKELQQVRKCGLNFIGCGISRIDARVLNEKHFHGEFVKPYKANPKVAYYFDFFRREKATLYNIPRTSIKFNTWYSANFYMEPPIPTELRVPLNEEHEVVRKYLESGRNWAKAGIHRQTGKAAVAKVLEHHMHHCLNLHQEPLKDEAVSVESDTT